MSFSADVKKELINHYNKNSHCKIAELAGAIMFKDALSKGQLPAPKGRPACTGDVKGQMSAPEGMSACTCGIKGQMPAPEESPACTGDVRGQDCTEDELIRIPDSLDGDAKKKYAGILNKLTGSEKTLLGHYIADTGHTAEFLKKNCCKRAFLRGAFIASGTISNPQKSYHLEFSSENEDILKFAEELFKTFDINLKLSKRRGRYVAYVKEAAEVSDVLNVLEAHAALLEFENIRVLRQVRGSINRRVNCETANITKSVAASLQQISDINLIYETLGRSGLEEGLREVADARLENRDMPLQELGRCLNPPLGKSGVNHRMRKISEIAGRIKNGTLKSQNI